MAQLKQFFPTSPDPFLVAQEDMALAKFGHLNAIVDAIIGISATAGTLSGNSLTEYTSGNGITISGALTLKRTTSTTKTGTGSVSAAELATGHIIYTGGVGTLTLPTATALATQLSATVGTTFDFVLNNVGGSGTATIALDSSMVATSAVTGGTTLTLANSTTQGMAGFRITFISTTKAIISRLY